MNVREWALPIYTILIQLATGTLLVLWGLRRTHLGRTGGAAMDRILRKPVAVMFLTILVAIIGSHLHLSNPLLSFLAVFNVEHSWLSREIVLTILAFFTCAALVDLVWSPDAGRQKLKTALGWAAVFFGAGAIFCMANIYRLPTQAPWNHWSTLLQFYATSLLLGVTAAAALLVMDAIFSQEHEPELATARLDILKQSLGILAGTATGALAAIAGLNAAQILGTAQGEALAQTSLSLLLGLYHPLLAVRFTILAACGGILIFAVYRRFKQTQDLARLVTPVYLACLLALVAEILGRFLFYATHVRMGL